MALTAAACSDGDAAAPDTASTPSTSSSSITTPSTTSTTTTTDVPTTSTTSDPGPSDEQQIIAVVERFYEVVIEANNPPDPESDLWNEVATPEMIDGLRARSAEKLAAREGNRYPNPRVAQVLAPSMAVVDDSGSVIDLCLRDDTVLYDLDSNEVLDDAVLFAWVQHQAIRTPDGWLLSSTTNVERFQAEDVCTAAFS